MSRARGGQRMAPWRLSNDPRRLVPGLAAVSAGVAALCGAAPTGIVAWDLILCAAVGGLMPFACSVAPRWVLLVVSGLAAAFGFLTLWGIAGWAALAIAVYLAISDQRNRFVGALVGALAVQALLRIAPVGFFGLPSLVAGVSLLVAATGAYRHAPKRVRRWVRIGMSATTLVSIVVLLIGGVALLGARTDLEVGSTAAQKSLDAARAGDTAGAASELERAGDQLESASDRLGAPWVQPMQLFPVVSQNFVAIKRASGLGGDAAIEASQMVRDIEAIDGSFDADAGDLLRVQSLAPSLSSTLDRLTVASSELGLVDSPWLLPLVDRRLDSARVDIDEILVEVTVAADATRVLPAMLGVSEPQHYLVFFGTPAESREFGGFVGSWALMVLDGGTIELRDSGRKFDLYPIANAATIEPGTSTPWFLEMARPIEYPENLTSSPDPFFVADMTRQVLGGITDRPLAGLIYLDAVALIDMLQLTGPVTLPDGSVLTYDNAGDFFYRDQYEVVDERTEFFESLSDVADTVIAQLTAQAIPGPEELGRVLGPAARAGHLQIVTFDDEQNDFLESVKLLRPFGPDDTHDFVALVQANGLPNKMDLYLERTLDYSVTVDDAGVLAATATVTLASTPPADAPVYTVGRGAESGLNRIFLSLYSPHLLSDVRLNGVEAAHRQTIEGALNRYLVEVDLPPTGEKFTLTYNLSGQVPSPDYSLEIWQHALINVDQVSVNYEGPDGSIAWSGPLVENTVLRAGS